MPDSLTDLILSLTPEDGSSIGNGAMMALLRERVPDLERGIPGTVTEISHRLRGRSAQTPFSLHVDRGPIAA